MRQEGVDFDVLVIDNASTDGALGWVREHHSEVRIISNKDNRGFAMAHNQGFAEAQAPYVLVLNPDVELEDGCLAEMVRTIEQNERIAAVCPKLYRTLPFGEKSGIIDSLGIKILPWGQVANIGENRSENAKFEPTESVWGVSGACALYRLSALEKSKDEHGMFDERFWMYKEDADLSWRLNRAGFQSALASKAIALHQRSVQKGDRSTRPDWVRKESYKNHLLMLKKNLSWADWWRLPFILVYELLKFIYVPLLRR